MTTEFKAKLRRIAKEENRDPAALWQILTLERFLARLARSNYRNRFVLKGGILLSKYLEIGRETTDLDFLVKKLSNQVSILEDIVAEIAQIDLEDGFIFKEIKANELAHPHMSYPGIEVSLMGYCCKTRFKVAIDIGFGDLVKPVDYEIEFTKSSEGALFEKSANLACYPKEFIFAEKLETIVRRGSFNSRMKDFHDIYFMISSPELPPFEELGNVIKSVFGHRGTKLVFPIMSQPEERERGEKYWNEYLRSLRPSSVQILPSSFSMLLAEINHWLQTNTDLPNT